MGWGNQERQVLAGLSLTDHPGDRTAEILFSQSPQVSDTHTPQNLSPKIFTYLALSASLKWRFWRMLAQDYA